MTSKPPPPPGESQNPADIAREAFRRLATRRIAPTPEAYRDIYNEIAGIVNPPAPAAQIGTASAAERGPETVLSDFATRLSDTPGDLTEFGRRFNRAVQARDWDGYARALSQLVDKHFIKKGGIETAAAPDSEQSRQLRDLLSRTLTFAVASLLSGSPTLVAEAESLGVATRLAHSEEALAEIAVRLKQLCYQIELKSGDTGEQQELLLRLFKLLLENVSELLDDDSWLRGQIESVQNLITGPIDVRALEEATRSLKEVIYKQGQLKHSISDVKLTVKNMMMTFIDRLGQVAASTGDFHEKIGGYSEKISKADNISELNNILDEVLKETRLVQSEALKARDKMVLARQEVQDAENRIHALEAKLQHLSELVREDQLTGSLNRRGLDDVFERETAREHVVQAAAVEAACQLVFAHQFAQMLQLGFQRVDAVLGVLHFLARQHHLVARLERLALHQPGFLEHFVEDVVELGDIVGLADLFRIAADLLVEVAGGGGHLAEAVDEGHHHVLDGQLDVRQAVLELALLVDHLLQAARGVLQRAHVQRAGDQVLHRLDLAAQPAVVVEQLADVLQQQLEQAQQQLLLLARVAAFEFDLVAQLLEPHGDLGQRLLAVGQLGRRAQRFGLGHQRRRARQQRRDRERQRAAEQLAQLAALLAVRRGGRLDAAFFDEMLVDQLRQRARVAVPVARLDGAVEAAAELGQVARRVGQARGEVGQHGFRAAVGGFGGADLRVRRRRVDDAGDLVINGAVGFRRRRDAPGRQTTEGFARDIGRVLRLAG